MTSLHQLKSLQTTDTSIFHSSNGFYPYSWVIDSSELSPYKLKLFSGNMFQIIQLSEFYCSMWGWLHMELHYVTHENMCLYTYLCLILYFSLCNVQYNNEFSSPLYSLKYELIGFIRYICKHAHIIQVLANVVIYARFSTQFKYF